MAESVRKELNEHIEAFLADGGEIKTLPPQKQPRAYSFFKPKESPKSKEYREFIEDLKRRFKSVG